MVQKNRVIINSLIAATFLFGMFAGVQGQSAFIRSDHQEAIVEAEGAQAPYGTWGKSLEEITFFLHHDSPNSQLATTGLYPPREGSTFGYMDYEAPQHTRSGGNYADPMDKNAAIHGSTNRAVFTVPDSITNDRDVRLYQLSVVAFAQCSTPPSAPGSTPTIINAAIHVLQQDPVTGTWSRIDHEAAMGTQPWRVITLTGAASSTSVVSFSGSTTEGTPSFGNGKLLASNTRLEIELTAAGGTPCVLHFDTTNFPSRIVGLFDSASLNVWTENKAGSPAFSFPDATRTSAQNRQFVLQVVHDSAWQQRNAFANRLSTPIDYQDRLFSSGSTVHQVRLVTHETGQPAQNFQLLSRTVDALGTDMSLNLVTLTYQYHDQFANGRYHFEVFSPQGTRLLSPTFAIGLKGFDLEVVGGATNSVNAGEQTVFRVRVTNNGAERDTITVVPAPPGANWQAQVINGKLTLEPGGSEEVLVRVTPSSAATAGATQTVTLTATSSFGNEVPVRTLELRTDVVSGGTAGVQLLGQPGAVEIFRGEQISLGGMRLHNTAPFVDTYLFKPVFPGDIKGWSATVSPPSRTVPAASMDDFVVTLRAAPDAPAGLKFNLLVHAQRIGSTSPAATLTIPVEVVFVPDVQITPLDATLDLRGDGSVANGVTDVDHDRSAVFRMQITNPTPVQETYRISGRWTQGSDSSTCDGTGSPDFWRMSYGEASSVSGNPTGRGIASGTTVTVPAFTTVYRFIELGYSPITPNTCTRPSQVGYELRATSTFDPGVSRVATVTASITSPGTHQGGQSWSNARHEIFVEPERVDGAQRYLSTSLPARQNTDGSFAATHYTVRVVNTGNERDSLIVETPAVPTEKRNEWSHHLVWLSNSEGGSNAGAFSCAAVSGTAQRRWSCPNVGAGDEATFRLVVQASQNTPLRRSLDSIVLARSGDDGTISDSLSFLTTTTGRFSFDAAALKNARTAPRGADLTLPFQISNVGTESDTYTISVIDGPAAWKPRLSSGQEVFVPAQLRQTGFVALTLPDNAVVNSQHTFRVQISSAGGDGVRVIDFQVTVAPAASLTLGGEPSDSVLLPSRGQPNAVTVAASGSNLDGQNVEFRIDQGSLPAGWTVDAASKANTGSNGRASVTFQVTPPVDALATSRVPLLVSAEVVTESSPRTVSKDLVMTLQAQVALRADLVSSMPQMIVAGGEVVYSIEVVNDALARDTIKFSNTALTGALAGWRVSYQPAELSLGPLESRRLDIVVGAPTNAPANQNATFTFFATSDTDPGVFDSLSISTVVGFNKLQATAKQASVFLGPDETADFVVTVRNVGTLPDQFLASHVVATTSLADAVIVEVQPGPYTVPVNGSVDVPLKVSTKPTIPGQVAVVTNLTFTSVPGGVAASTFAPVEVNVLRYKALDIDGDMIMEYAIDRDRQTGNGFEEFRESRTPGGKTSRVPDMASFLSPAARQSFMVNVTLENGTVVQELRYVIDGDRDGRVDHFVDFTGDGLPDAYWDPDNDRRHNITVLQDVDADSVADYFVATRGAQLDAVFNIVTGRFTPLLRIDVDGDGVLDFAVDKNGNGLLDADETVLYSRGGILVTVLKVDIDGDGKLDDVFDLDGDRRPDSFVRNGETIGRAIVLRDVNGDGVLDWVYDSNLDGRMDAYYDPYAQTGGHSIDTVGSFWSAAKDFWFVPATFMLVLVLFVVLVVVTRRR